jgi:hypothetical protein
MFRIRFRLVTLLAVVAVAPVCIAFVGTYMRDAVAEDRALHAVAAKGGLVLDYHRFPLGTNVSFPSGQWRIACPSLVDRTYLPLTSKITFGDADLELLADIRDLQRISFEHSNVSAAAMQEFKRNNPQIEVTP